MHNFARKMPQDFNSFGKKLSHPHNMFRKINNSIKHFNHNAIPALGVASALGVVGAGGVAGLLKGGEALTGIMSGHHQSHHASFDGQSSHSKHRRPILEK